MHGDRLRRRSPHKVSANIQDSKEITGEITEDGSHWHAEEACLQLNEGSPVL